MRREEHMRNMLAVFILSLFVCGCGSKSTLLRHPETDTAIECKGDAWDTARHDVCVQGYEQAGYVRIVSF
jgi:glycerol uptake facilitator-like aquaporin